MAQAGDSGSTVRGLDAVSQASSTWADWMWLVIVAALSAWVCIGIGNRVGATFDEPFYVRAGLTAWRTGSNKQLMRAGTMTLPVDVQTLPVYLWERWRGEEFVLLRDLPQLLPVARLANLTFWWLLLLLVWRVGLHWGGRWGGRAALLFVASEPNLLAHAALATTDIAAAACLLLCWYTLWRGQSCSWPRRVLLPGLTFGLALTAKASALVYGVLGLLVFGLWQIRQQARATLWDLLRDSLSNGPWKPWKHVWKQTAGLRRDVVAIVAIGLAVAFTYTGCDWGPEPTFIRWAEQLPDGPLRAVMVPLSHRLTIFTNAGEALLYQIKHNIRGHDTYICGQWYRRAVPWYFPLAWTMKTPLSVFALLLLAAVATPRRFFLAPWTILALLLLLLSPTYRVQIGIRFLFPAMVLLVVMASASLGRLYHSPDTMPMADMKRRWLRPALALVLGGLLAVQIWDDYRHWPHLLAYFNAAWGGPAARDDLLHESNYDWGQGLPELRQWCKRHGVERLAVWYYGMDPAVADSPLYLARLSHEPHGGDPQRLRALCGAARLLAVSVGCLRCNPDITPAHREALGWLETLVPVARTRFFLIYKLDVVSPPSVVAAERLDSPLR